MADSTMIKPVDLNYNRYNARRYDRDIINSIPAHRAIHTIITAYLRAHYNPAVEYSVLDLGAGTGLSSKVVRLALPRANFDIVDFSRAMLNRAKQKIGPKRARYILADYTKLNFDRTYDMALSIIGCHHQSNTEKKGLFKKIYRQLKPGGIFIFADLVTYRDHYQAAYNNALHYHRLVEKAASKRSLVEWSHHHMFLNKLTPLEDQIDWLKIAGFKIVKKFHCYNTALIIARKT